MEQRSLGRSGLKVSRLGLGTMTFGQPGWGCDEEVAGQVGTLVSVHVIPRPHADVERYRGLIEDLGLRH